MKKFLGLVLVMTLGLVSAGFIKSNAASPLSYTVTANPTTVNAASNYRTEVVVNIHNPNSSVTSGWLVASPGTDTIQPSGTCNGTLFSFFGYWFYSYSVQPGLTCHFNTTAIFSSGLPNGTYVAENFLLDGSPTSISVTKN